MGDIPESSLMSEEDVAPSSLSPFNFVVLRRECQNIQMEALTFFC